MSFYRGFFRVTEIYFWDSHGYGYGTVADPEILKKMGGAEDNVSDLSSFIANTHNELHDFCTKKATYSKKIQKTIGAAAPTTPLNRRLV